jgi:hypothetical protein
MDTDLAIHWKAKAGRAKESSGSEQETLRHQSKPHLSKINP